jgi:hypothetical protein
MKKASITSRTIAVEQIRIQSERLFAEAGMPECVDFFSAQPYFLDKTLARLGGDRDISGTSSRQSVSPALPTFEESPILDFLRLLDKRTKVSYCSLISANLTT